MKVRVRLFAIARQLAEADSVELELTDERTAGAARRALVGLIPDLQPMAETLRIAVNSDYVDDDRTICETDELACIPPVSGG